MTVAYGIMKRFVIIVLLVGALGIPIRAQERHQVELESTYLGDGWFQYRLRSIDDPFFLFFDVMSLYVACPGFIQFGTNPPDWESSVAPAGSWPESTAIWEYPDCGTVACQSRPYERVFRVRSDRRHFNRRIGALVTMSLSMVGGYHGNAATVNMVGYMNLPALLPCAPEEADGSATNHLERVTLISLPDPQIDTLIRFGSEVRGVSFYYPESSTVRLEATRDFRTWSNITYIYGNSGVTGWSTNSSLNHFGDFFRLRLIAEGHATQLPPLESQLSSGYSAPPAVKSQATTSSFRVRPQDESLEVEIRAEPGTRHTIKLLSNSRETLQTRTIEVTNSLTRLVLDRPTVTPAFVTVTPVP
jgi:hypothetical protein